MDDPTAWACLRASPFAWIAVAACASAPEPPARESILTEVFGLSVAIPTPIAASGHARIGEGTAWTRFGDLARDPVELTVEMVGADVDPDRASAAAQESELSWGHRGPWLEPPHSDAGHPPISASRALSRDGLVRECAAIAVPGNLVYACARYSPEAADAWSGVAVDALRPLRPRP
jgi:hypothetical protein